jgi:hypothetical protein
MTHSFTGSTINVFLAAFAMGALPLQCIAADKYERLDPSISCALEGVSFVREVSEVTKDGQIKYKYKPGGEVSRFSCAGQQIEVASRRLEASGDDVFVATKKYGKIKVVFGGTFSQAAEFWVTPEQNAALKALKRK